MKKKILMTAVVAAMAAPLVASAEAIIYGKLHLSLDNVDYSNIIATDQTLNDEGYCRTPGLNGWDVCSRASRLGFKGSEDLGGGLKAIWKVEFGVQMADSDYRIQRQESVVSGRDMYVGLAGDWGTALIGRSDTPYKLSTAKQDIFADTLADYNFTAGLQDLRTDNAVAYISPSWGGFTLMGAAVQPGGATAFGNPNPQGADGFGNAWSLAGTYSNGPFYAAAAYESIGDEAVYTYAPDAWNKWRLGLGWETDMFGLNLIYENQEDFQDITYLNGQFKFGNNAIKAMWSVQNATSGWGRGPQGAAVSTVDQDAWALGFDHSLSKRTKAYVVYTDKNADARTDLGDWSGFSMGMIHNF